MFAKGNRKVYELIKFKEECRSWAVDNQIIQGIIINIGIINVTVIISNVVRSNRCSMTGVTMAMLSYLVWCI